MSTLKQKELAYEIVANSKRPARKRLNKKELLVSVGYSDLTARAEPGRTLEQKGVKMALNELGFSVEAANKVVAEILHSPKEKARDRLTAAQEVYKVHGEYAPEKHLVVEKRLISFDE